MTTKLTVRGIIYDKDKNQLLCQKIKALSQTTWYLPGGTVEEGENLARALERELEEECGVAAKVGNLVYINQFFDGKQHVIAFIFNVLNVEDFHAIDLASTSHGEHEISEVAFISQDNEILPTSITRLDLATFTSSMRPVFIDDESSDVSLFEKLSA